MKKLSNEDIQNALDHPVFRMIGDTADELDLECYVIGGWVRDLFLQRKSKDIDIVVAFKDPQTNCKAEGNGESGSRPGIMLAEALRKKLKKAHIAIYRNFGTAQLKSKGVEIEFVGARKESYDRNSRKPITEDGTLEEDQNRRDFTINALALCLNKARYGELVDPFDGIADLEDGIIATPLDPDITFSDDPLRMMRCIRFATQLNFYIEDETFEALSRNKERIKIISGERIADELNKIMLSPNPSKGFIELDRCGLLELIFPEMVALQGVETRNGRAHKDNFYHTLEVLENVAKATEATDWCDAEKSQFDDIKEHRLWLRWAALMHDIGKPKSKRWDNSLGWTFHNHNDIGERMIPTIFRRMKLPMNEKMKYVQKLVGLHMRPIVIADEEVTDSAVRRLLFEAGDDIDDLMLLCTADITSKNEQKKKKFIDNFKLVRKKLIDLEEKDRIRNFQPPVSGEEIMELFDLKPCREIGILKNAVKDAILDGKIPNEYEPAKELLIEEAQKLGLELKK
ncbi:MAG: CCA tRNA nucleotidyltransferase [Bacteroidaceae bacterium]|nr:CCA tRNA nucleotidyltransferase [Bacteroidaceae bacterium]